MHIPILPLLRTKLRPPKLPDPPVLKLTPFELTTIFMFRT